MDSLKTPDSEVPSELRAHIRAEGLKPPATVFNRSPLMIARSIAVPFIFLAVIVLAARHSDLNQAWIVLLGFPVLLAAQRAFQTLVHDTAHKLIANDLNKNDILGDYLVAGWIGASIPAYRAVHTKHHRYNGSAEDPEHISYADIKSTGGLLKHSLRYVLGLEAARLVKKYYGRSRSEDDELRSPSAPRNRSKVHIVVCQAILAFLFIHVAESWPLYLLWLYLAVTWNPLLSRLRFLVEHPGNSDLTVSTDANLTERLFFAPFNFHCHLEHHLWPNVPPYRLAMAHEYLCDQGYFDRHPEFLGRGFVNSLLTRC